MSDSDIRRLLATEEGLPADRRDLIKERVMSSIGSEAQEAPVRRRRMRRLVPTLAGALVMAAAVTGAAAALGLFPQQSREILDELGCRNADSVEEMVASAQAADGRTFQFWVTKANEEAAPNGEIVVVLDADGTQQGGAIGCGSPDEPGQVYATSEIWAAAPNEISAEGALASVIGHVPAGTATATVTFSDGSSADIEVQSDGYFLGLVSRPDITIPDEPATDDPAFDVEFPEPVSVAAFAEDGTLIAEHGQPWGP